MLLAVVLYRKWGWRGVLAFAGVAHVAGELIMRIHVKKLREKQ